MKAYVGVEVYLIAVCKSEAANTVGAPDDERRTARNVLRF